jgi:hypothetical protein
MLAELEAEVRPLLDEVRATLGDMLTTSGKDTLTRFLADAPVEACIRLGEVWDMAQSLGVPTEQVKARFNPEDQFLVDFVTTVYGPPSPGTPTDLPALGALLDEPVG